MKKFNRFHEWYDYLAQLDVKVRIAQYTNSNNLSAYDMEGNLIGRFVFENQEGWVQL